MKYIFSQALFAGFVMASYFAIIIFRKKEWKYIENRLFFIFCISSAIWSLGFFGVFVQTVPDNAYSWRALGMIGTFGYLISAQMLICYFSEIPKGYRYFFNGFSLLGVIIYFFNIQKEQVTYYPSSIGMTYSFNPGIWNNLYTAYTVIVALDMLFVIIYMLRHATTQRIKVLAKKLLLSEIIIMIGMVLDTIFPFIGLGAIPGSSISQFLGLVVIYYTIIFVSHSRINISNMSEFIYYSLTVPVLVYDSKYKLQILNDTAYSFLGVDKENFDITGIEPLFKPAQKDIFNFEQKSQNVDAVCCHNQLFCSLSVNKIYDDYKDIIGYIIIVTDLSERMKTMKKLEVAMEEAECASRAKSTFLANMSHEIRTPMNAIMGFSELVLKENINDEVRRYVEDIKWSSHNLIAIINDILDISKIESGKMELVLDSYSTVDFLNDISMLISQQAEKKGLTFHMKVDMGIPKILYGDKVRLRSVVVNILNNAVKYTQKGSVSFVLSIVKQTAESVTLEFKVIDTGIGIKEKDINNLFNSFERFDEKINYGIEGSGLGLAISNSYVKLMGGSIKVSSVYKEGSTFTVTLDQKIIDSEPIERDYNNKNSLNNAGGMSDIQITDVTALVTDDNLINLRVAQNILKHYGLTVDTALSGKEAIALCKQKEYSFIFMDRMMPEMDGIETMNHIRTISTHYAVGGDCKIIVLTADVIKGTREYLLDAGFDEYLGKPMVFSQLEQLFLRYIPAEKINHGSPS